MGYAILGLLLVAGIVLAIRYSIRNRYFAHAEYWVYIPGSTLPKVDTVMETMVRLGPFAPQGVRPATPFEALLFSDVRLHIALVLRSRNPHVFRPDLFDAHVEPSPELLAALASSQAIVKVRFISEDLLLDRRHLNFLPHAAAVFCKLGDGQAVYDAVTERLMTPATLEAELTSGGSESWEWHTRVVWKPSQVGGSGETRGLKKVGLVELRTEELDGDQRVLATMLLEEAMRSVWDLPSLPLTLDVNVYGDAYRALIRPARSGFSKVLLVKLGRSANPEPSS